MASFSSCGVALLDAVDVEWMGCRGLRIGTFSQFLLERWTADQRSPQCIIIHVGSNDLGILPKKVMFESIKQILAQTRELLPHTVIFWSQILPQVVYVSAMKRNKIEWVGHAINRWVGALFRS